jgi:hypothetical protein
MKSLFRAGTLLLAITACSDDSGLPDPTITNVERTETLYALEQTPVGTASAYAIEGSRQVRTDVSVDFDFAYNVETGGQHVLLPRATLGIDSLASVNPGLLASTESFEGITTAASNGYITDQVVPIALGERYMVRGRVTCLSLGLTKYGKIEVVAFDDVARTITFRVLTDDNCGFKGLQPGLPNN